MASYLSVARVLDALKAYLDRAMEPAFVAHMGAPEVKLLSTMDMKTPPDSAPVLGIYAHRISVDPHGRTRSVPARTAGRGPQAELPVNIHVLLIGWSSGRTREQTMLAWAMQVLAGGTDLDAGHMLALDPDWNDHDRLQIIPEDMTTEDLMRIWDGLPPGYMLSTPYVVKTIRLGPTRERDQAPQVTHVVGASGLKPAEVP